LHYSRGIPHPIPDCSAHAAAVFEQLHTGENFIMIKLPAGRYTFKYVYYHGNLNVFEIEDNIFITESGVINYVGSLYLYANENSQGKKFDYKYIDNYAYIAFFLDMEYPNTIKKYPVQNKTPHGDRETHKTKRLR
jgi:hypothetical protein